MPNPLVAPQPSPQPGQLPASNPGIPPGSVPAAPMAQPQPTAQAAPASSAQAPQASYAQLGQLIQRKYPQYANMDPNQVGQAVAAQYPQYASMTDGNVPAGGSGTQNSQSPSVGGFLGNLVSSAGNFVGGIGNAVMHPIQTAENLGGAAVGGVEEGLNALGTGGGKGFNNAQTQGWDSIVNYYRQRYGSPQNFLQTAYRDPIGFLADASMLASGVGAGLGAAGDAAEASKAASIAGEFPDMGAETAAAFTKGSSGLSKAGAMASGVGEALNPISPLVKVGEGAVNLANKGIASTVGVASKLGYSGANDVLDAARGAEGAPDLEQMTSAARGETTGEDVVAKLQKAQQDLISKSRNDYKSMLKTVDESYRETNLTQKGNSAATVMQNNKLPPDAASAGQTAGETFPLSAVGTKGIATRVANELGIEFNDDGSLNFSNSRVPRDQYRTVQNMFDDVNQWTRTTPQGLNDLENKISGYYKPVVTDAGGKVSNYVSSRLSNGLKDYLRERIPEFEEGDKLFSEQKKVLSDFKRDFSLGGKAGPQTILSKVRKAATADGDLRAGLVKQLEGLSGVDLKATSIGFNSQGWTPHGLLAGGELLGSFIHPQLLAGLAFASPRLSFEFLRGLGIAEDKIGGIMSAVHGSQIGLIASRTGSLSQTSASPSGIPSGPSSSPAQIRVRVPAAR